MYSLRKNLQYWDFVAIFADTKAINGVWIRIKTWEEINSQKDEIKEIAKLLRLKNAGNRAKQKLVRHDLRTIYEFNISDFNEPGKAFGEVELQDAIQRGAIQILDDATIADMKAKRARDKAREEAAREQQAIEAGEMTDWKAVAKEWEEWENSQNNGN